MKGTLDKMNEEEKKAVEFLKENLLNYEEIDTSILLDINSKHKILLNLIEKLQKENEELKSENRRLKVIRYSTEYGTENIHLITKRDLVEINTNKYFIEIQDGKFVDLKQVYQENEELKADNYELNNRINDLLDDISVQKVKDKIEENEWAIKGYDCDEADYKQSQAIGAWSVLQELIEEREKN